MRRITFVVFSTLSVLLVILTSSVSAQSRSVVWNRWDVFIDQIDTTNNHFRVTEKYDVVFDGTFRFGQRLIPYHNLEEIRNIQVYQGGYYLQNTCTDQPGTSCIRNVQEGISIVYHFLAPITNDSEQFTLSYTVVGALRVHAEGDQLWWIGVTEDKFGYPVRASTITVDLPNEFSPRIGVDPVATYGAPGYVTVQGSLVTAVTTESIAPHESFEIRVQYPHDPNARIAVWQDNFNQQREFYETVKPFLVFLVILGGLAAVFGPPIIFYMWYSNRSKSEVVAARSKSKAAVVPQFIPVPEYLTEPPSDLPPAFAGMLVDEKADVSDILSTLVDLGNRGYVVIEEKRIENDFGGASDFVFKRTDKDVSDLHGFEKQFINTIFTFGALERTLGSLQGNFYENIPGLQNQLYREMIYLGLFKPDSDNLRKTSRGFGVLVFLIFGVLFYFFTFMSLFASFFILIILGFAGLVLLPLSPHVQVTTPEGSQEAAKWRAFKKYLSNLQNYTDLEEAASKFQEYLPYAIAFGIDQSWIRRFSHVRDRNINIPTPEWYFPYYYGGYNAGTPLADAKNMIPGEIAFADVSGGLNDLSAGLNDGLESISDGLTKMLNMASSTLISTKMLPGVDPWSGSAGVSGSWIGGGDSWSIGDIFGGSGGGFSGFG